MKVGLSVPISYRFEMDLVSYKHSLMFLFPVCAAHPGMRLTLRHRKDYVFNVQGTYAPNSSFVFCILDSNFEF